MVEEGKSETDCHIMIGTGMKERTEIDVISKRRRTKRKRRGRGKKNDGKKKSNELYDINAGVVNKLLKVLFFAFAFDTGSFTSSSSSFSFGFLIRFNLSVTF